jgi:hypothetical protein
MVPANVETIGSGFIEDNFVGEFSTDSHLRLGKCGLKKVSVPKPRSATISLLKVGVKCQDKVVRNEGDGHYLASALRVFRYFRFVLS